MCVTNGFPVWKYEGAIDNMTIKQVIQQETEEMFEANFPFGPVWQKAINI